MATKYTVLNRTEVLEEIKAALPAEDSEYEYEFEGNLPAVLPLESKAYVIHRHDKSFETSFDEPCESLIYMNRQGSENSETTADGVYTVDANNNVLITEKNYKYFDMEFDVKVTGMTQPRFAILLGLEDSQVDKCYAEVFNNVGANAFMLNGGANNNVRYFKDGNKVETTDYFATIDAPDYVNTFVNVKIAAPYADGVFGRKE